MFAADFEWIAQSRNVALLGLFFYRWLGKQAYFRSVFCLYYFGDFLLFFPDGFNEQKFPDRGNSFGPKHGDHHIVTQPEKLVLQFMLLVFQASAGNGWEHGNF